MLKSVFWTILSYTLLLQAQTLTLPESPRVLGMGGAFVAIADDPQGGFINPAAIRQQSHMGYDAFYQTSTQRGMDHFGVAFVNPNNEGGNAFALGVWTQGVARHERISYYVPYTASSWKLSPTTFAGLTVRYPYRVSRIDSIKSRWRLIGDASVMQTFQSLRLAAAVERVVGGAEETVPRQLRLGAAIVTQYVSLSYEWRALETNRTYDFHYLSQHLGAEITFDKYVALRAGYRENKRMSLGTAIGLLNGGWRFEAAWEFSSKKHRATRWSVGMGYRA